VNVPICLHLPRWAPDTNYIMPYGNGSHFTLFVRAPHIKLFGGQQGPVNSGGENVD
jgi:hypothetical protein